MDPVTLIVRALGAGASLSLNDRASGAVGDAYGTLRSLVAQRLTDQAAGDLVTGGDEGAPEAWEVPLAVQLTAAGAADDSELLAAAQALMRLIDEAGFQTGKRPVDRRRTVLSIQTGDHNNQDSPVSSVNVALPSEEQASHTDHSIKPWACWSILVLSALLAIFSWRAFHFVDSPYKPPSHPLFPGLLFLVAIALSSFMVRGPRLHYGGIPALALLGFQISFFLIPLGLMLTNPSEDSAAQIELAMVGLLSLAIVLITAATWLGRWPLIEPAAIGLISIALGAICIPGVRLYTQPPATPKVQGSAFLFATGMPEQPLSLSAAVNAGFKEVFHIKNTRYPHSIHWALLVTGDARGQDPKRYIPQTVNYEALQNRGHPQLYSGTLNRGDEVRFVVHYSKHFCTWGAMHVYCWFPTYGEGDISSLKAPARTAVLNVLKARPVIRGQNFTIKVVSGHEPTDSLAVSVPTEDSVTSVSNTFGWTSHHRVAVRYITAPSPGNDPTPNALFVYAVILGAAGGGLIVSIQGIIGVVRDRTAESRAR
jgi:hypothetical protein